VILADTGFFIALIVRTDKHHKKAFAAAQKYASESLITTWPVLTETLHLAQRIGGPGVARSSSRASRPVRRSSLISTERTCRACSS